MRRPNKLSIIGNGVVIDPWALFKEIEGLRGQGVEVTPETLKIAGNACLILPLHARLAQARDVARGSGRLGTTGRGIGPAYEDKVARRAIRVCDLADAQHLGERVAQLLLHHNALLRGLDGEEIDPTSILEPLREMAPRILPYADTVWRRLDQARRDGQRGLFEGAQGALLDVDHGTYPFVTSSNTLAGTAAGGSGLGLAIVKHLCRASGVSVSLHSLPGHGSTYTLRFPR